jgi:hypothetical protein
MLDLPNEQTKKDVRKRAEESQLMQKSSQALSLPGCGANPAQEYAVNQRQEQHPGMRALQVMDCSTPDRIWGARSKRLKGKVVVEKNKQHTRCENAQLKRF